MNPENQAERAVEEPKPRRLASLDAFRGLTVFGMIVVNTPGSWSSVYSPLRHARWHGWTPTDQVFPSFLFIVGVAIALALSAKLDQRKSAARIFARILFRSVVLFALGLFLNGFPKFALETYRIPGVLQRIAVCYFLGSLVQLAFGPRGQIALLVALLVGYWAALHLIETPSHYAGDLSRGGNLGALIDRAVLGKHTYRPEYDPEGILSTLPALGTTIIGMLTGSWVRNRERAGRSAGRTAAWMLAAGLPLVALGVGWGLMSPINKALWTGPFVFFTGGISLILLAICFWRIEACGDALWPKPFIALGANAIAAYVLSSLIVRLMGMVPVGSQNLQAFLYRNGFQSWLSPMNASLAWALTYAALITLLMMLLYSRKIIIKI